MRVLSAILTIVLPSAIWAAGSTFTWKGAEGDGKWSTPGNWQVGGVAATKAPGSSDTVVFDSTSGSGTSYVDAGLSDYSTTVPGATVYELQLKSDFTGSVVLQKKLNVWYKYTQDAGTFTCGDNDIRFGDLTSRSYGTTKYGNFYLNGGTFNAPSGEFQYYSVSHQVYCQMNGGTFNHNNGTFIIETSCGGGTLNLFLKDRVFNNFIIRRAPGSAAVTSLVGLTHTNTVLGSFVQDAGRFATGNNCAMFDVKGDCTFSGVASGGEMVIKLATSDDQHVYSLSSTAKAPAFLIEKPAGKKVIFDGNNGQYGLMVQLRADSGGATQYGGLKVVSGDVDMSTLSFFWLHGYHSAFYIPDDSGFEPPQLLKFTSYFGGSSLRLHGRTLNDLYVGTTDSKLTLGTCTNTVLGDLTIGAGGLNGDKTVINLKGDLHADASFAKVSLGGGTSKIVMNGDTDQVITVTNNTLGTLIIDKPAGTKVSAVCKDNDLPFGAGGGGYESGGGSLYLKSGTLDLNGCNLVLTNGCYGTFEQTGGEILWHDGWLKTYVCCGGHTWTLNFGERLIPRYEVQASALTGSSTINISGQLNVSNLVQNGSAMNGSPLKIYGDHYVGSRNRKGDARGQCSVRYCGNADQRFFAEADTTLNYCSGQNKQILKTGGRLILDSDMCYTNWTGDTVGVYGSGTLDLNGHALRCAGTIEVSSRLLFSGGNGQVSAPTVRINDGATIAYEMPHIAAEPFVSATNAIMPKNGSLATNGVEVVGRIRRSDARSIPLIKSVNSIQSYGKDYYDAPTWRLLPHQRIARQSVNHDTAQHQITHEYLYMDPMVIILR